MDSSSPHFIVNPVAAGGVAGRRWPAYRERLRKDWPGLVERISEGPGAARKIAADLSSRGVRHIVAVGGDGTHHEVINGLIEGVGIDDLSRISYALLPVGSGNDWVRTHGISKRLEPWIRGYRAGKTQYQNLGKITCRNENGGTEERYFANVAGLAYDAFVVRRSAEATYKNRLLYPLMTLWYLKDYVPQSTELIYAGADDSAAITDRFYTINVGIGKYSGGGMRLVPHAVHDGEEFALTYARHLSVGQILLNGHHFYTGRIGSVTKVTTTYARSVGVKSLDPDRRVEVEADGEWLGYGPVGFTLVRNALKFVGFRPVP